MKSFVALAVLLLAASSQAIRSATMLVSTFSDASCTNCTKNLLASSMDEGSTDAICLPLGRHNNAIMINTTEAGGISMAAACTADCKTCTHATVDARPFGGSCMSPTGVNALGAAAMRVAQIDTDVEFIVNMFIDAQCSMPLMGGRAAHYMSSGQCVPMAGTASFGFVAQTMRESDDDSANGFSGALACSDAACTQCKLHVAGPIGACVATGRGFYVQALIGATAVDEFEGVFHADEIDI